MNIRKAFREIVPGKRTVEITADDEADELNALKARMFGVFDDVEYYGPGAAEANARRAAALARDAKRPEGTTNELPAVSHKAKEKKARRRMTKRERLEAKAAALRAEIEALKDENPRQ